jgi:hypothetical protein
MAALICQQIEDEIERAAFLGQHLEDLVFKVDFV